MPSRFRSQKKELQVSLLQSPLWRSELDSIAQGDRGTASVLMGFLTSDPVARLRAAIALGRVAAAVFDKAPEEGRDIVRRLSWRLSEESGNIGWGVPEAMGEILSHSSRMAKDYRKIFFSTLLDLGFDDNYVDNDTLRRSCYFAIGRFIRSCPEYGEEVRPLLRRGLDDVDLPCRGYAAWALGMLAPDLNDAPALRRLAEADIQAVCELTDGDELIACTVSELASNTMHGIRLMDRKEQLPEKTA